MAGAHRRWTASRALALVLALWGALGPTASALHLALAPHAICPEHGELIEVAGDPAHSLPGTGEQEGEPASGDHLHCAAVAPLRASALSAPGAGVEVAAGSPKQQASEAAADAPRAPPCVLTCAPKQSPPARA